MSFLSYFPDFNAKFRLNKSISMPLNPRHYRIRTIETP
jgi:hypothetical protein